MEYEILEAAFARAGAELDEAKKKTTALEQQAVTDASEREALRARVRALESLAAARQADAEEQAARDAEDAGGPFDQSVIRAYNMEISDQHWAEMNQDPQDEIYVVIQNNAAISKHQPPIPLFLSNCGIIFSKRNFYQVSYFDRQAHY